MNHGDAIDRAAENLYRVKEFHEWVRHNHLFPQVPDRIVNALRDQLRETEWTLLHILYEYDAIGRAEAIQKQLVQHA